MKIKANGITMNYELAGQGNVLVLIHGAADNLNGWYNQVPALSQHYKVLTYDVRGHGQTDITNAAYSYDLWAEDLYALLQALNLPWAYVLGYSMGGPIAATLALKHPEKGRALILSNTGSAAYQSVAAQQNMQERRRLQLEALQKEGMLGIYKFRLAGMVFSPGFAEKNPKVVEKYREILLQNRPEGCLKVYQSMGQSTPPDFSQLRGPTLIIAGEHDPASGPDTAKAMQRAIPGSEVVIFPTGHASAQERPKEYNEAVLSFLRRVEGKAAKRS